MNDQEIKKMIADRFRESPASAMLKCGELAASYPDTISFAIGDPDLDTPREDIEQGLSYAKEHHLFHYGDPLGLKEYREAVVREYREDFGVEISRERVIITSSATHGMMLALLALVNPGDEVIILSPYFTPYEDQIRLVHGIPVEVNLSPENGWQIDPLLLEKAVTPKTKAIIVNTPQNPLGVCFTRASLEAIARCAKRHHFMVIADDIYTIFSYTRPFIPIMSLPGMLDSVVTIRSCSKDFCMTGFRIGYAIASPLIIQKMNQANESLIYSAPSFSQAIGYHALLNRKKTRKAIRDAFKARLDRLQERIKRIPLFSVLPPEGAFYLFMDIRRTGMTALEFTEFLLETCHVLVLPGDSFGKAGEGFVRFAATASLENIDKAFDRIEAVPRFMTKE